MTAKKAKAAPKKAPAKAGPPPVPKAPGNTIAALVAAFEQGRRARRSAITRAESPFGKGVLRDQWCMGWDYEDGLL